jgi:hypothetical protein
MPRLLPLLTALLVAACLGAPRFDDGSGHRRPLAALMLRSYAGHNQLGCADSGSHDLLISADDGSIRIDQQPFVDADHPGDLVLEGNGGSPAHSEPRRIGYSDGGQPGALRIPAYPATLSLTVQRQQGGGIRQLALVRDLGGGEPRITLGDDKSSDSCRIGTVRYAGRGGVEPGWLIARLAQKREVMCRRGIDAATEAGRFEITAGGVVRFPDGRQWPVGPEAGVDWNFQLQDLGSFGRGGYRLLLDSDVTPRSLLGREVGFDHSGRARELHFIDADVNSVNCRVF